MVGQDSRLKQLNQSPAPLRTFCRALLRNGSSEVFKTSPYQEQSPLTDREHQSGLVGPARYVHTGEVASAADS